jgi:uncharacterized protein YbbK (DUF523 family)/uncharacterized protein YbgA (DUF1722 family)
MSQFKIKIAISSCLLGKKVRYDGRDKRDDLMADTLANFIEWIPVCPEAECGLGIPRQRMRLEGDVKSSRLVSIITKTDHTALLLKWSEKKMQGLNHRDISGFVFKSKSPSCALRKLKIHSALRVRADRGMGLFARQVLNAFPLLPLEDDLGLHDPSSRENFIVRAFAYRRWMHFLKNDRSAGDLREFHDKHKLLIMAHSSVHERRLHMKAASAGALASERQLKEYGEELMQGLKLKATIKKNVRVLRRILRYLEKDLAPAEKREILEALESYEKSIIPLIIPIVLIRHSMKNYGKTDLKEQLYLHPHPLELMLRNHA